MGRYVTKVEHHNMRNRAWAAEEKLREAEEENERLREEIAKLKSKEVDEK
jgi:hypothetical protein